MTAGDHFHKSGAAVGAVDMPKAVCGTGSGHIHHPGTHVHGRMGKACPGRHIKAGGALVILKGDGACTVIEYIAARSGGIALTGDGGQCSAGPEGGVLQLDHIRRNGHLRQSCTAPEGIGADGGDIAADGHIRQRRAVIECTVTNGGNTIFDHNRFDQRTAGVPGCVRRGSIIRHGAAAGDGHNTLIVQAPCQIFAAGSAGGNLSRKAGNGNRSKNQTQNKQQAYISFHGSTFFPDKKENL